LGHDRDERLEKRLVKLASEGIEVKVITSDDKEKHHQEALKILRNALKPPRCFLFRKSDWVPPNMELGIIRERYLHVKLYVFDDKFAVVGSANLTESGMWNNIEHIVIFDNPEEIQTIRSDFLKLWKLYTESKETAVEVTTLEDIAKSIGKTVKELASLLSRLRKK